MQTFDFEKTLIVPPHCLWVSGLLLISGCRVDAGLPRLQSAWHPAGNRLAVGEKAPGAWGAPGADLGQERAADLASLWAGGTGKGAGTAQLSLGNVSLNAPEFLLWGGVSPQSVPVRADDVAGVASPDDAAAISATAGPPPQEALDDGPLLFGKIPAMREEAVGSSVPDEPCKQKVLFHPKPEPWDGIHVGGGKAVNSLRPASFCRKVVTFNPTSNLTR